MNYYNPYFNIYPYATAPANTGLMGRLFSGISSIKWGSILSGTQKVLGVANQAIPMIRQVGPVVKNAKTMFKVMNEFKKVDTPVKSQQNSEKITVSTNNTNNEIYNDGPVFFI